MQILVYSVMLAAAAMAPAFIGFAGVIYTVGGAGDRHRRSSRWPGGCRRTETPIAHEAGGASLFTYSLSYLFVIFLALVTDYVARRRLGHC